MAPHGWRKSPSVGAWIAENGSDFDFLQVVAMLENAAPDRTSVGAGSAPRREAIRFRSSIAMSFPRADIERVRYSEGGLSEVTVAFLGLTGAIGPLPQPFAELVARRSMLRDHAMRDFLDLFHHRLISIFYRVRKRHQIGLGTRSPEQDEAARYFFALLGLHGPGLAGRLAVPDRALLHYAGILARPARSLAGLETLLRAHFGVAVRGVPFTGQRCAIEDDDRTAIGRLGRRRALGKTAMIGSHVWIQDAAFEVVLGPLDHDEIERYLPGGDALLPLCALIELYVGDVMDFTLTLRVRRGSARGVRLGRRHGGRLGYTTWLAPEDGTRPGRASAKPRDEIRLSRATLASYRAATVKGP